MLSNRVGFDLAFAGMVKPPFREPLLDGIAPRCWAALCALPQIGSELQQMTRAAMRAGGVVVDTDLYPERARQKMAFYEHCVRPNGTRSFVAVHLELHGEEVAVMHLCRTSPHQTRFSEKQLQLLRDLRPALALGFGTLAFGRAERERLGCTTGWERLSPREREIAELVGLGFTNPEIALACGTSPNTVRNQLVAIFEKMETSTRAELAALVGRVASATEVDETGLMGPCPHGCRRVPGMSRSSDWKMSSNTCTHEVCPKRNL